MNTQNETYGASKKQKYGNGRGGLDPESSSASGSLGHYADSVRDFAGNVSDQISSSSRKIAHWTKENPMQTALLGAGIGFLAGTMVRQVFKSHEQ